MDNLSMNDLVIMADNYFRRVIQDYHDAISSGQYKAAEYIEQEAAFMTEELIKYGIMTNGETDD